jgi:hypothetical protein
MRTAYMVLREKDPGNWEEMGDEVNANSAATAIRMVADDKEGRYVAVPMRSWQPRNLEADTITRVRLT